MPKLDNNLVVKFVCPKCKEQPESEQKGNWIVTPNKCPKCGSALRPLVLDEDIESVN